MLDGAELTAGTAGARISTRLTIPRSVPAQGGMEQPRSWQLRQHGVGDRPTDGVQSELGDEWDVDWILQQRVRRGARPRQYSVRWAGFERRRRHVGVGGECA